MACEFCQICNKMAALKETRDVSGVADYPLTTLKAELCDATDSAQRTADCVALADLQANNRASQWAK